MSAEQMRPRVVVLRDAGDLKVLIAKPLEDDPDVWGTVAAGFPTVAAAKRELQEMRRRQYGIPRLR